MFEIVVSRCKRSGDVWIADGELHRTTTKDPIAAKSLALFARNKGVAVVLRPRFSEPHLRKTGGFREWQSFDGDLFDEIHWNSAFGGPNATAKQVRLDTEIVLPHPLV